jgi:hypothetical protein
MNYYDTAVDFYSTGEDDNPNIEEMLNGKEWVFVELDEQSRKRLPFLKTDWTVTGLYCGQTVQATIQHTESIRAKNFGRKSFH